MEVCPQITVAIPTYHGSPHVAEALRGILSQECPPFDLLICDDCSSDDTLQVVNAEAGDRARILVNSERLGLAGNWNRCVSLCRTPLITIFHQDDRMEPGHLAAHLSAFDSNPDLGLVCGAAMVIDDRGDIVSPKVVERGGIGPIDRTFAPGEFQSNLAVRNPLRCSAISMRTAAHQDVGGFDPSYRYVVDWDFWLRVARRWPVAWLSSPTVSIRWHTASETHRFKAGTADLEEVARLQAALLTPNQFDTASLRAFRRAADRRLSRAFLNRAYDCLRAGDSTLARSCLGRAIALWPGILGTIAIDPRVALTMGVLSVAPQTASRWFARR